MTTKLLKAPLTGLMATALLFGSPPGISQNMAYARQKEVQEQRVGTQAVQLKNVLNVLKSSYQVDIMFELKSVDGLTVPANVINMEQSLERNLDKILTPFGLTFKKVNRQSYLVLDGRKRNKPASRVIRNPEESSRELIDHVDQPVQEQYRISGLSSSPEEAYADRRVSGKVTDESGGGLPGVSILLKGTQQGTLTDADGRFGIDVPDEQAVLVFSFVGYASQEVVTGSRTMIEISLKVDEKSLEEVVVVGYGTAKRRDLTGAIASVNAEMYQNQPATQVTDILSGTVAGFNSNQSTSAAGGGSMQIRGPKSLNAGTSPMIVLDGVIYNGHISDINPRDIETIDILKDASSAAVFGARAAAGVVVITTKKGRTGKPTITVSSDVGVTEAANDYRPYYGEDYLHYRADVLRTFNPDVPVWYYDDPDRLRQGVSLEQWRNESNNPQAENKREWLSRLRLAGVETESYLNGELIDWYNKVMHKGVRQNYDVSIRGGNDRISYYWSLGYQNNDGVILGDRFSTVRSRLNVDVTITDWLKAGTNIMFADRDESAVLASVGDMMMASPYGRMYNENGELEWYPNGFQVPNPLIDYYGHDRMRRVNNLFTSIYGEVSLPFGIRYKLSFQPRYEFIKDLRFWSSNTIAGGRDRSEGYGTRTEASTYEWIADNLLHWNQRFGAHKFDVTLLYSAESRKTWSSYLENQTFVPNQNLGYHGLQFGTNPALSASDTKLTGDAAMARLNYTLKDKYLLTASVRRDGYSAFGISNPRAWFPAAAFAWIVSEEPFFKADFINQAKLRVSWGVNGNRDIGLYAALASLASTLHYNGTNVQVGLYPSSLANYSLKWERTESVNIGVDLEMMRNRLSLALDYYDMTTTNLLMDRLLPKITGFESVTSNLGELGNKGVELTINSVNVDKNNLNWKTGLVFSLNRNKVKRLFGDFEEVEVNGDIVRRELPDYSNEWFPGQAVDRVWNYDIVGIWQEHERDEAAVYGLLPGDFKTTDVDGNGKFEPLQDKQFIGYTQPRYRLGLRNEFTFLKHFSFSTFFRADLGHIGVFSEALHASHSTYDRRNSVIVPYWMPDNPSNEWARLNPVISAFGGGIRVYKPRSFVRIQDVSLGYSVPQSISERLKMSSMRVFLAARNAVTFHNWPGWDPESGGTAMPRTYSIGINVSL